MNSTIEALGFVIAMGAVILLCRAFPFLLFIRGAERKRSKAMGLFLNFVEKIVPPVAMTVLAFNAIGGAFKDNPQEGLLALAASVFTALLHLWKKNFLISILGGTILFTLLI